ncbi:MAG TPA: hypothetical protein VGG67_11875 [Steroidobacteraceae bacterium]
MSRPRYLTLKFAIIADGRKQQVIATEALLRPQMLCDVLYGRREVSHSEQLRLARVLKRSLAELFPKEDEPPQAPLPRETAAGQ